MIGNFSDQIEKLPETEGIFIFKNSRQKSLYVGIAQNIKLEIKKMIANKNSFLSQSQISKIEFIECSNSNLINSYAKIIEREQPLFNISLSEQSLYPHFKITGGRFPQLQITRKIQDDNAEYFGAFLPETKLRLVFDFLIRKFQLRSCVISINGDFSVPCTQFYEKLCLAPCVENICEPAKYDEFVKLLRLFLQNKQSEFEASVIEKIETASAQLDFETAKFWRDWLYDVQTIANEKRFAFRLDDAVDSFEFLQKDENYFVHFVTQRGGKILGRRVFVFEETKNLESNELISQIVWQFYRFHAPKEIRVPTDFSNRKFLSDFLSRREKRKIEIKIIKPEKTKITTSRAFGQTKFEFDFSQIKPSASSDFLRNELRRIFRLKFTPKIIECFDVAHISGTNFVAAMAVWKDGEFSENDYQFWREPETNELKMLQKGVENSFAEKNDEFRLIVVDGGKAQLKSALAARKKFGQRNCFIIAAVKPPQKHNEISHFIDENANRFAMKLESEAMKLLVRLRDEAHNFANRIHRTVRDSSHFYELAELLPDLEESQRRSLLQKYGSNNRIKKLTRTELIKIFGNEKSEKLFLKLSSSNQDLKVEPLIVPIRYDAPEGNAVDLQPLRLRKSKDY